MLIEPLLPKPLVSSWPLILIEPLLPKPLVSSWPLILIEPLVPECVEPPSVAAPVELPEVAEPLFAALFSRT
jgi:hypothetical protein